MTQLTLTGNYVIIEKLESIGCDWSSSVKRKTRLVSSWLTLFPVLGLCKLVICMRAQQLPKSNSLGKSTEILFIVRVWLRCRYSLLFCSWSDIHVYVLNVVILRRDTHACYVNGSSFHERVLFAEAEDSNKAGALQLHMCQVLCMDAVLDVAFEVSGYSPARWEALLRWVAAPRGILLLVVGSELFGGEPKARSVRVSFTTLYDSPIIAVLNNYPCFLLSFACCRLTPIGLTGVQ